MTGIKADYTFTPTDSILLLMNGVLWQWTLEDGWVNPDNPADKDIPNLAKELHSDIDGR